MTGIVSFFPYPVSTFLRATLGLMLTVVLAMSSFVKVDNTDSRKSCTVKIKCGCGDPASNIDVRAFYGGIGGQHDFKTDDNGVVTLTWEYSDIEWLYIKGDKYESLLLSRASVSR